MKKIVIYTLFLLMSIGLIGQVPAEIITLEESVEGNLHYIARERISGTSEFSYHPTDATESMIWEIDPEVFVPKPIPTVPYRNASTAVDGLSRTLSTTKELGGLGGKHGVTPNGAATYAFSISVPPGVNGLVPAVSITYNSMSGNGLLGKGWNLSGVSLITRGPKSLLQEEEINAVTYTSNDRFFLDGQRLILTSGSYGYSGSQYRTEIDNLNLVELLTDTDGKQYFKVHSPNGRIMNYKQKKVLSNGAVAFWLLSEITDLDGNRIIYNYIEHDAEFLLDRIDYADNKIEFYYERRTADANTYYMNRIGRKQNKLLKEILVYAEDNLFLKYGFHYQLGFTSLLNEITLEASDGKSINSTVVNWNEVTISPQKNQWSGASADVSASNNVYYGDFNGDGRTDRMTIPKPNYEGVFMKGSKWKLYITQSDGRSAFITEGTLTEHTFQISVGDFINNDGKDDIMIGGFSCNAECTYYRVYYRCYAFNNNSISNDATWECHPLGVPFYPHMVQGDFTGDGKLNFFVLDYNGESYVTFKRNFGGYLTPPNVDNEFLPTITNPKSISVLNYNGNSRLDIRVRDDIYEYNPSSNKFECIAFNIVSAENGVFADFNGDGLSDFCPTFIRTSDYYKGVYLGTGNGFNFKFVNLLSGINSEHYHYINNLTQMLLPIDANGDGKSDIIRLYFSTTRTNREEGEERIFNFDPKLHASLYLSRGESFSSAIDLDALVSGYSFDDLIITTSLDDGYPKIDGMKFMEDLYWAEQDEILYNGEPIYSSSLYRQGRAAPSVNGIDVNSDGNADLLFSHLGSVNVDYITFIPGTNKKELVRSITNGLNQSVRFNYTTLFDSDVYSWTHSNSATNKHRTFITPLWVVKELDYLDNGIEYANETYSYENATMHYSRGFLGMQSYTSNTDINDITTTITNTFIGNEDMVMLVPQSTTTSTGETSLTSSSSSASLLEVEAQNDTRYYQVQTSATSQTNHLTGVTTTVTQSDFNSYNQPETVTKSIGSDLTETKNITYSPVSNPWLPTRVASVTINQNHSDDSGENYTNTTTFNYFTNTKHRLASKTVNSGTSKALAEEYTYESFGAIRTIESYPRRTRYEYTDNYKFVHRKTVNDSYPVEYTYDHLGNVLTETDHNNLLTTHTYNSFGRRMNTTYADGNYTRYTNGFSTDGIDDALFVKGYSTNGGTDYELKWYNARGQLLRTRVSGLLGTDLKTDYEYYNNGKLHKKYVPYTHSQGDYTEYKYRSDFRLDEIITPEGTIDYSYPSLLSTRVSSPSGWNEKTYDACGLLQSSRDEGGTISYNYYNSGLLHETIYNGNTITMHYDEAGNLVRTDDPDRGTELSTYNRYGEQTSYINASGISSNYVYDNFGRITDVTQGGEHIHYAYNAVTGMLDALMGPNSTVRYTYDELMRPVVETETIEDQKFVTSYNYNQDGTPGTTTFPGGFTIENKYDRFQNVTAVKIPGEQNNIWEINNVNNSMQVTQYTFGNGVSTQLTYDENQRPWLKDAGDVFNWEYNFRDDGNLENRINTNTLQQENFEYDALNRLTQSGLGSTMPLPENCDHITYGPGGSITSKDIISSYYYEGKQPHAVSGIDAESNPYPTDVEGIGYTWFDKVAYIEDENNNRRVEFVYGNDQQRRIMRTYQDGVLESTKYYIGNYEKIIEADGHTREYTYVGGPGKLAAVHINDSEAGKNLYYIFTDYLGSIMALSDDMGNIIERYHYNAWGERCNPDNWAEPDLRTNLLLDRGFTGHEHLVHFSIINMNGRIYDPVLGMFLSPDPYTQAPDFTQNYNPFGYCYNNPLIYTDPSGEFIGLALFIVGSALLSGAYFADDGRVGNGDWDWEQFGKGAAVGAILASTMVASAALPGLSMFTGPGIMPGLMMAGAQFGLTALNTGAVNWMYTGEFQPNWGMATISTIPGILQSVSGGLQNKIDGKTFFGGSGQDESLLAYEYTLDVNTGQFRQYSNLGDKNLHFYRIGEYLSDAPSAFQLYMNKIIEGANQINSFRIWQSALSTVSAFHIPAIGLAGYFLEPKGPETTTPNQNQRIPAGTYDLTPNRNKYPKDYMLYNSDVSAKRGITIHSGNTPDHTRGCLLPGTTWEGGDAVWSSVDKLKKIRAHISSVGYKNVKFNIFNAY